jgi:general secretion pathway protein H
VAIDGERRILIGDGGSTVALPPDVVVDLLGTNVPSMSRATVVRFHPDGASSGAVLRLSREKVGYEIRVNWYTGGVSIEAR